MVITKEEIRSREIKPLILVRTDSFGLMCLSAI